MARTSKYSPELVEKLTTAIRLGGTYRIACDYAGISEETFNQWRKRYPELVEAIKEAEGAGAVGWLAKIEKAANEGTWQAAAWKLERRYPELYGRSVVTSQSVTPEQAKDMTDDQLTAELKKRGLL